MMNKSDPLRPEVLSAMRCSKAHPRSLPVMPPKELVPTNNNDEKECILGLIETEMSYRMEERVEKKSLLSKAEWNSSKRIAQVTHKTGGGWEIYGFDKGNESYLSPEEALFLVELSRLELWFSGIPVSVQQAYQLLLKEDLCSLNKYKVYAHLNRLGYRLQRVEPDESAELKQQHVYDAQEPRPKRAKLDGPPLISKPRASYAALERRQLAKHLARPSFLQFAGSKADLDGIPNLAGEGNTFSICFPNSEFVPKGIPLRDEAYSFDKFRFSFTKDDGSIDRGSSLLLAENPKPRAKDWQEYEKFELATEIPIFTKENHPLYQGNIKPLLNGDFSGDILYRLDVVGKEVSDADECHDEMDELPICYRVYSPSRHFKKSNPGPPCYYLAITSSASPFPKSSSLLGLRHACSPNTKVLIGIVGSGSSVTFFELKEALTPFQP